MGTVLSVTSATATAYGNQRKMDRCQNGVLWSLVPASGTPGLAYSTDNGATWTAGGQLPSDSGTTYTTNGSIFIDADDCANVAYKSGADGYIKFTRGTPNAARTAYTWSAATQISPGSSTVFDYPDIVVCRNPATAGTWVGLILMSITGNSNDKVRSARIAIAADGTVSLTEGNFTLSAALGAANSNPAYASVDFNHTGDGKTVAGGTPHWYVGWSAGATGAGYGIRFRKATYAAGSWTWGTEREIDNTGFVAGSGWLNTLFDGARVMLVGYLAGSGYHVTHERDAADTATIQRTWPTISGQSASAGNTYSGYGSCSYDGAGNLYMLGVKTNGTRATGFMKWTRSSNSLDMGSALSGAYPNWFSFRRGPQGQAIDYVYTDGTASPYTVTSGRITLNQAPTAPSNLTPADGTTFNNANDTTITFTHQDPDGDAASAYRIRYRPAGLTVAFTTLSGTTSAANGGTVTVTIPAGTWAGDVTWAPATVDASGVEGAYAAARIITGIPTAIAAATGGQGGTAAPALSLYNQFRAEQALRSAGRSALATVASVSPLQITVDGSTVNATRNAGYTPTAGDVVEVGLINDGWVIRDRVIS